MAKLFISYSTKDHGFVTRLANDLKKMEFDIWLDRWEIDVGDDIFDKIQFGIRESDYVILVLSSNSISSGWVDKEWKMAYWNEISSRQVKLLPVLLDDCEIPEFLKFKKYADFRRGYGDAFKELLRPIKSKDLSSIKKPEDRQIVNGRSKLEFYKKIFSYASSYSRMNMPKEDARQFALQWCEQWSNEHFELFKKIFSYAYSYSGLNMPKGGAKEFALQWLENYHDRDFQFFRNVFSYAYSYSGLNMSKEDARQFALQWLDRHKPPSMPKRPT